MTQLKHRLKLVEPRDELSGKFPHGFEKAVRSCKTSDRVHRALIFSLATLSRHAVQKCVPPSALSTPLGALRAASAWAQTPSTELVAVRQERHSTFEALTPTIETTLAAISKSRTGGIEEQLDEIGQHADRLVTRYMGLAVHYSLLCVTQTCDAIIDPMHGLEVTKSFAASVAYRNVALGACRDAKLRASAREQAAWEHEALCSSAIHSRPALELQLMHEYLGIHWKNHVDAHRVYAEQFLNWVFPDTTFN
jgi:hypothetical protein